ncbi:MAG: hypothetical protein JO181_00670 [Solirubrobacterales bacterium]|nr:hypothetical protein [Solirubrobacterales bacterium]
MAPRFSPGQPVVAEVELVDLVIGGDRAAVQQMVSGSSRCERWRPGEVASA